MSAEIAVAVVSWNTRELLADCLRSLAPDHDAGRAEVWVVDNASSDGSAAMVRDEFRWAHLVENERNLGFGPAVNLIADRTSTRWLAPANADVALAPRALENLIRAAEEWPDAGAVAPRLTTPEGEIQHSVHAFPTVGLATLMALGLPRLRPSLGERLCIAGAWDSTRSRRVDWAHGAFLLVRRVAWDEVGGFDPKQWMFAEDLDLAWRLTQAGWTIRYEPSAQVEHVGSAATAPAFGEERNRRFMLATFAWMARRRGLVITYAYALVSFLGAAVRWVGLSPLAAIAPRRWAGPRDAARSWMRLHGLGLRRRRALIRQD